MTSIDPIIRPKKIPEVTGLSISRAYDLMSRGQFPRPIKLGAGRNGAVGWRLSTLVGWLDARASAGDGPGEAA